jgi:RHS repeat-associated protein
VGSYSYHATKKHAVIAAGSNTYAYDANGNLVTRNGVTQSWTSSNLPAGLSAGGYSAQFAYAPDRSRWRQVSTYAGGTETTIYVGGMLEKLTTAVRTHWKHRIPTPSGEVQVIRRSDGTNETLYLTTDHLGSTDTVMNAAGTVLARTSFTAWGARRGSGWTDAPSPSEWQAIADTSRRGYTGHEALDNVLLVHMNGRVYDPAIGRFLSADPYVDGAGSSQGWNRYSYVRNNPLKYSDPSGYTPLGISLQDRWRVVWKDRSWEFTGEPGGREEWTLTLGGSLAELFGAIRDLGRSLDGPNRGADGNGGSGRRTQQQVKDPEAPPNRTPDPRCKARQPDGSTVNENVSNICERAWRAATDPYPDDAAIFQGYGYWIAMVRPGGRWDYKQQPGGTDNIGNYNYGATGTYLFPPEVLARVGGADQILQHAYDPEHHPYNSSWGTPMSHLPRTGDDPRDTQAILAGANGCP